MESAKNEPFEVVKTSIPKSQKSEWKTHADELGMSQSEFIRTMVQAGRKGFEGVGLNGEKSGPTPRGKALKSRIQKHLVDGPMNFEKLCDELAGDLEDEVETALEDLKENGVIEQRTRGGFELRRR